MSAWKDGDPLCAAYALALLSDLPRGRILGLIWPNVSVDRDELDPRWQVQRVGGRLIHRQVPAANAAQVSLPQFCRAALKRRREDQAATREQAGARWRDSQLVFTTRWGSPIEPRNLNRSFATRCAKAGVPRTSMRDARRACAPLPEDLLQDTDSDS
jgi:site-specific recombinase XerC